MERRRVAEEQAARREAARQRKEEARLEADEDAERRRAESAKLRAQAEVAAERRAAAKAEKEAERRAKLEAEVRAVRSRMAERLGMDSVARFSDTGAAAATSPVGDPAVAEEQAAYPSGEGAEPPEGNGEEGAPTLPAEEEPGPE